MKIKVINGPNLNLLGVREPEIYGKKSYAELEKTILDHAAAHGVQVEVFQSNGEGEIVDAVQRCLGIFDGIVINPAAYTHTSVAILDALRAVALPAVEVHLSDVDSREEFRRISYAGMACEARFTGMGFDGYLRAIDYLLEKYGSTSGDVTCGC